MPGRLGIGALEDAVAGAAWPTAVKVARVEVAEIDAGSCDVAVGGIAIVRRVLERFGGNAPVPILAIGTWEECATVVGPWVDQVESIEPIERVVDRAWRLSTAPGPDEIDFRALAAAAPYLVGAATFQGERRYLNAAGRKMLGYGEHEAIYGLPVVDTFRERPSFMNELMPHVLEHGSWTGENVIVDRHGAWFPVFQTLFLVRDGAGDPAYVATFMRDLRETKALEDRLRTEQDQHESVRALLSALLDSWPGVVGITIQASGTPIYLNERGRSVFGLLEDDSLPASMEEFYPRFAFMRAEVFPQLERHGAWSGRNVIVDRHGQEIPVHQTLVRVADPNGDRALVATFIRDMRELELLEERARTAEAQRRELADRLDSMRGSVDLVAAATVDGQVTLLNESGRKMLGIPADQSLDGSDFTSFYPPRVLDVVREGIRRAIEFGVWSDEVVLRGADGTEIPVHQVIVANYDASGRAQYLSTVVRDLRDLDAIERLEARAQRAEQDRAEAENAERAKTLFLANMSHEIRTPLNAVLGYAQLLDRRELDADARVLVQALRGAGEHLLALIDDVLDISKVEAGAVVVVPTAVDLSAAIDRVGNIVRPRCEQRGLDFILDSDLPRPCWVELDEKKLIQILTNLLGNAVKFTERGLVRLSVTGNGDVYQMTVTDTGPGMTSTELAAVFSPFSQGRAGEHAGGTGLGLSIARGLAHAMGGELHIRPGRLVGLQAQLTLTLPSSAPKPMRKDLSSRQRRLVSPARLKALVVDDVAHNRDVLRRFLTESGVLVETADDGLQAVEAVGRFAPDVVLMDLRMPHLDGAGALARCRVRYRGIPTKYVAVSATQPPAPSDDAAVFDGFLRKPISLRNVYAVLEDVVGAKFDALDDGPQDPAGRTEPDRAVPEVDPVFRAAVAAGARAGKLSHLRRLLEDSSGDAARRAFVDRVRPYVQRCDLEGLAELLASDAGAVRPR